MSQRYPPHQQFTKPPIVVTDNDVLSGRGVNIAAHAGNERFRTLVTTRADASYCEAYSATEKKAVAEEIVRHITTLDPPGRFLKREGRGQVSRGLNGPWEELSRRESIKKTCQALRDCNRADRATYAHGVAAPEDVKQVAQELATSGVALKERASKAAEECAVETSSRLREAMEVAGVPEDTIEEQLRRQRADPTYVIPGFAMTAAGTFAPIAQPGYPAVMQVIGPDGIPIPTHDPVPTPGQMPGIYSMYPHPAVDAAPINMEAHLAARVAAGYVHPDDRAAQDEADAEAARAAAYNEEEGQNNTMEEGDNAAEMTQEGGIKEVDAAAAAEEAAAAVADMDSAVAQQEGAEAADIAAAIAQDAAEAFAKTEEGGEAEPGGGAGVKELTAPAVASDRKEEEIVAQEEGGVEEVANVKPEESTAADGGKEEDMVVEANEEGGGEEAANVKAEVAV
eukprot:CAMPEP_0181097526 /NCGR_PEP_ID=MMETSP1071-20121207/11615_1 /TAXON_ID=35127 /ORGANISM="Thalassiosira sp., Strain NH16" /LENGTH=452 /DNA_ID=CAMNT_0023180011 /DNA_START=363 /DNA_END=1721 /DNA_ORIENTATION=+